MASQFLIIFSIFLLSTSHLVLGNNAECGSLITYRQHSVLLSEAPQCFRNGCSTGNTTSTATTISSLCPINAPCNKLWDIIRGKFEQDWCDSCHGDIACRIGGWPILNMTEACNVSPGDWIFAGNGGCCSSGTEPFQIAEWIQTLCNGSEWREPFTYYGGMAKEDWEEWIEPWNWTVRPQNTSTYNITTDPGCNASAFLLTLGLENIFRIVDFAAGVILAIVFQRWVGHIFGEEFHWWKAIAGGFGHYLTMLGGSIGAAIIIVNTPGYEDIPVVELIVLITSRPSVLGFLSAIGILAYLFENGQYFENPYMAKYAANTAAGLALCEGLQQATGSFYYGRTANVGRQKDFFHVGHLTPFWHGSEAQRMYAGGLIWTMLSPWTITGFLYLAYLQAQRLYLERNPENRGWISRFVRWAASNYLLLMNAFYANKRQRQENQAREQQQMAEALRSTDRLYAAEDILPEAQNNLRRPPRTTDPLLVSEVRQGEEVVAATEEIPTHAPFANTHGPWSRLFIHAPLGWMMAKTSQFITSKPLHRLVTVPYIYLFADDIRAQDQATYPAGMDAITRQVLDRYPLGPPVTLARPVNDVMRRVRIAATIVMLLLWIMVYISQWLFWSGFVQSSGTRWCPPNNELSNNKIRAVLIVLPTLGSFFNFIISA